MRLSELNLILWEFSTFSHLITFHKVYTQKTIFWTSKHLITPDSLHENLEQAKYLKYYRVKIDEQPGCGIILLIKKCSLCTKCAHSRFFIIC